MHRETFSVAAARLLLWRGVSVSMVLDAREGTCNRWVYGGNIIFIPRILGDVRSNPQGQPSLLVERG